ncbi:hypothetical protein [Aquamicrobium sp.]|uniref:maleate cis-trans isomerase family protein n=1 Tax=Aquamicrobium sp. TaxID=1872579 RepID=UPI00258FC84B|nr:hypothetical protein [Aquamicrobium sp.]MCK9552649.1 hypothetical protein [Aquamicrobium sp.]
MMAPEGVQFVTTRMPFTKSGLEDDIRLVENIEDHAALCAHAKVELILFNCTAASMAVGADVVNDRIEISTGVPSVTTIEGVLGAMTAAGMKRIALLTPYIPEVVEAEIAFLEAQGFVVVTSAGIPCDNPIDQASIEPEQWRELAAGLDTTDIDGLLISCAGTQIANVLEQIEQDIGKTVVASNQAALWLCLKRLGIPIDQRGYGALLAGRFEKA